MALQKDIEFGKLNFAVGFNRTSAFPLEANSYFEDYNEAVSAAASAVPVGSSDSAFYIGQLLIVKDATVGVGLYQINAGKTLTKFGQASSADELAEKVSALEARCTTIEGKLILATADKDGLMSKDDFAKLTGIAAGAQVNKIEGVQLDGVDLTPDEDKKVNVAIAGTYLKKADAESTYVAKEEGKGLSSNDYDATAVAEVAKIKDKAEKTVVEGIDTRVGDLETKIAGVTGAMHFKGVLAEKPSDLSSYEPGDVIIVDKKEYVCAEGEGGVKEWHELGDEGSHLTKEEASTTYKTIESYNTEKAAIEESISGVGNRVTAIENDYLKAADKTELSTAIGKKADQTELDKTNTAANTLKGRVDTIEGDYLKGTDKTALEEAIGLKAAQSDLDTANGKITALETKVGKAKEGEVAATGLFKAIDDEVAARTALAGKVSTNEGNITTLQTAVGTSGDEASDAENASLFARVNKLSADIAGAGKIDKITVNGVDVPIDAETKTAAITLPTAFITALKEGETNLVVEEGKLSLAKVSTDLLENGSKELVIYGGDAN